MGMLGLLLWHSGPWLAPGQCLLRMALRSMKICSPEKSARLQVVSVALQAPMVPPSARARMMGCRYVVKPKRSQRKMLLASRTRTVPLLSVQVGTMLLVASGGHHAEES